MKYCSTDTDTPLHTTSHTHIHPYVSTLHTGMHLPYENCEFVTTYAEKKESCVTYTRLLLPGANAAPPPRPCGRRTCVS
jgi:hypothetical protein